MKKDGQRGFAADFERAVKKAARVEYAQRLLNRAVPAVGSLTAAFLAVSWSGAIWPEMPPSMRMAGVLLYGTALAASLWPLKKVERPGRDTALERLDRENGPNRPASTYNDIPADEDGMDSESRMVWDLERRRIARTVGAFKTGVPHLDIARHDPYRIRYAALAALGIAFLNAAYQGEAGLRIAQAFDWKARIAYDAPLKLDAWVNPPAYTGEKPLFIATRDKTPVAGAGEGAAYAVPVRSVLTLMVHDKRAAVSVEGETSSVAESCKPVPGGVTRHCEFTLSGNSRVNVKRAGEQGLVWRFNVTPDLPPRIEAAPFIQGDQAGVTYELRDEYKAPEPQIEIEMKKPETGAGAKPLFFPLPGLTR